MAAEPTKQAVVHELERAFPGSMTGRSLVSLVDEPREPVENALRELVVEGRVERRREKGMTKYRLNE